MKLEDHMDDRQAFELALLRVRGRAVAEGRTPTHREMLAEAQRELEEENRRLAARVAELKASGEG